jgi:cell division protein FtsQ
MTILSIVLLIWGYSELIDPRVFPIKTVIVDGEYTKTPSVELQNLMTPYAKQGLFGFSAIDLKKELQQLPWVDHVIIRRVWPETLDVTLSEKQPIVLWNKTALLTTDGILFTPDQKTMPTELPQINGPDDKAITLLAAYKKMNQFLTPLHLTIQQFNVTPRNSWTIILSNQIMIIVGKEDIWNRWQQFVVLYPKVIGDNASKAVSVDLRYSNGIAVVWKKSVRAR